MLDSAILVNQFLLRYNRMLVTDIADERLAEQPLPGVNHPAWILGHLAFSTDAALGLLGADKALPAEWVALFNPGSKPLPDRCSYPSKDALLKALEGGFERVRQRLPAATPEQLAQPTKNPRMREGLPTVKEGLTFLLTGHLGLHLGQLSSWRRLIGLPPLF
jgi:hypothetical protein